MLARNELRVGGENREHILALSELLERTPPILVHRRTMRVIDGMHRLRASELRGDTTIAARLVDGSDDDVFVLSVHMNNKHGLPLSRSERRRAAERVVRTHPAWSDRKISSLCGVSPRTVASVRAGAQGVDAADGRLGADGRVRSLDISHRRTAARRIFAERPRATVREVARLAGVSTGTAHDVRRRLRDGVGEDRSGTDATDGPEPSAQAGAAARRGRSPAGDDPQFDVALAALQKDPAVRSSTGGRAVLRLLGVGALMADGGRHLLDDLPPHCASLLAAAARRCSTAWARFAEEVQELDRR